MAREFVLLVYILLVHSIIFVVSDKPQVPCYFILGDSMVDSGNNNNLKTKWKVNYPPYGIDFPEGFTGRFTNGRTSADIIGQLLGFDKFIPSFATATDQNISKGVNYASGGSGIREETGSHMGDRISLDRQLRHHNSTISRLLHLQQNITFLKDCIYLLNTGSNDYINNYFMPQHYTTSNKYSTEQYADVLIQQYSKQLKTLYNMGGRKIAVFGLTQMGCTPYQITKFGTQGQPCVEKVNNAIDLINARFKPLVEELNNNNPDAIFTFINITSILYPQGDMTLRTAPCCEVMKDWPCVPNSIPCTIRSMSIFFDGLHPTDISNTVIAARSYNSLSPMDAYPYDIRHLAQH